MMAIVLSVAMLLRTGRVKLTVIVLNAIQGLIGPDGTR